jgi:hypothetical protein
LGFISFKNKGSTPHECKQFLEVTSSDEKPAINQFCVGKLSRVQFMGSGLYSAWMDSKGLALERFSDIKKKKRIKEYMLLPK